MTTRLTDQRTVVIVEQRTLHTQVLGLLKPVMELSPSGENAADALPMVRSAEAVF